MAPITNGCSLYWSGSHYPGRRPAPTYPLPTTPRPEASTTQAWPANIPIAVAEPLPTSFACDLPPTINPPHSSAHPIHKHIKARTITALKTGSSTHPTSTCHQPSAQRPSLTLPLPRQVSSITNLLSPLPPSPPLLTIKKHRNTTHIISQRKIKLLFHQIVVQYASHLSAIRDIIVTKPPYLTNYHHAVYPFFPL